MCRRVIWLAVIFVSTGCSSRPMVPQFPADHPANVDATQTSMPRISHTLAVEADEGPVKPAQSSTRPDKPEETKPQMEHPGTEDGEKPAPTQPHHHGGSQ